MTKQVCLAPRENVLDSCNWVRIIYMTDHDIDALDMQTKRDILAHNKTVLYNCPELYHMSDNTAKFIAVK
ncbi:hypothetical protein [Klebsiella quasipneumoniae]|uniref:hypothetical protein n=1 Tax=Klebsiella quasipneumoniae TaxID=1463165 RepID=UPI003713BDD2